MPALFNRRTNAHVRATLAVLALLVPAVPLALMGWVRTPYALGQNELPEQPVEFDHRHHVRDDGIDCRYCHWSVERTATAGIPPSALCMNCHAQVLNGSPLLAPVRASVEEDRPIPWVRVHQLPDFVFFDHSLHVVAGVGCESCHGRVDRMARVRQVAPLTMGWCLDCHRDPASRLRPPAEVTTMGWRPDGERTESAGDGRAGDPAATDERVGAVTRTDLHPGTDCTTCHR